jgi:formylglycine-generating enzyme required for sulfatase activity
MGYKSDINSNPKEDLQLPAHKINWDESREFSKRVTRILFEQGVLQANQRMELPTEAQWEYACRAGTSSLWYFGDNVDELVEHAWYAPNSDNKLHRVGLKKPNPWGLYDVYGNVEEWCLDGVGYSQVHQTKLIDPLFHIEADMKIVRGGAYDTNSVYIVRSAGRQSVIADNDWGFSTGLRTVCISSVPFGLPELTAKE